VSKRELVIFPSKLKRFNHKDPALFSYDGLCYCAYRYAKLAAINAKPLCLLINTTLGAAVKTRTTRRLPKELVEDLFEYGSPPLPGKRASIFSNFFWRLRIFSWEYTWINPCCSRAGIFFQILSKIFVFVLARHDINLKKGALFGIYEELTFIHY